MKEIKNFLEEKEFLKLQEAVCNSFFPWFRNDGVVFTDDPFIQFTHTFYKEGTIHSTYFGIIEPLLKKINPFCLLRAKLNLITKTNKIIEHGMHVDVQNKKFNKKITTAIYYINTNNGYTKFINNEKIKSEENKFVSFNSTLKHTGTSCTNKNYRIVLNLNYFK